MKTEILISKAACEFQGSSNLLQIKGSFASAPDHYASFKIDQLYDNSWVLSAAMSGNGYVPKTQKGLILITLPLEFGIQKVTLLSKTNSGGGLENVRLLVSNTKPSKFTYSQSKNIWSLFNLNCDFDEQK